MTDTPLRFDLPVPRHAAFDIVGLGVNVINHLYLLPMFPEPDTKVDPLDATQQGGGVAATAMVACARLSLRTKYVGKVGPDDAGRLSRESLGREGIDVTDVVVDPTENTRVTFGLIEKATGRRTLIRGVEPLARLRLGEVAAGAVTAGRILHLDGYEGAVALWAARTARAGGIPVSLDAEEATQCREELFPLVDILIMGRDLGARLTECRQVPGILDQLERLGPSVVGLTLGAEGAVIRHRSMTVQAPGYAVNVVDTTGAGDVFHGAFLAGVLWGWPIAECLRLANAAAGLKCRKLGGRAGIPTLAEIREFIRATGRDLPPMPACG